MTVLESTIEFVRLYHHGATVVRHATLHAHEGRLPEAFELGHLPLALDDGSMRVRVESKVANVELLVSRVNVALHALTKVDAQAQQDRERLDALERQLLQSRTRAAQLQREYEAVEAVPLRGRPRGKPGEPPAESPFAARSQWQQYVHETREGLTTELRGLRDAMEKLQAEVLLIHDRMERAQQARRVREHELAKSVKVQLQHTGASVESVLVVVEYFVPGARWAPTYQLRIARDGETAQIQMRAVVAQNSGEDWRGVRLELCTADPGRWAELPELSSQRIGKAQPPPAPRTGFRPPPRGAEGLFADFDRDLQSLANAVPMPSAWMLAAPTCPEPSLLNDENDPLQSLRTLLATSDDVASSCAGFVAVQSQMLTQSRRLLVSMEAQARSLREQVELQRVRSEHGEQVGTSVLDLTAQLANTVATMEEHQRVGRLREQAIERARRYAAASDAHVQAGDGVAWGDHGVATEEERMPAPKGGAFGYGGGGPAPPPPPSAPASYAAAASMAAPIVAREAAKPSPAPRASVAKAKKAERRKSSSRDEMMDDLMSADAEVEESEGFGAAAQRRRASAFHLLQLMAPEQSGRSGLRVMDLRAQYNEALEAAGWSVPFDVLQVVQQAITRARSSANLSYPAGASNVRSAAGWFDFSYRADDRVDVPSDGGWHSIPVGARQGRCAMKYVVVPREDVAVYRQAEVENPVHAPLLAGPVDVYVNDEYVLSTALPTIAPRETARLGLGVEQAIRCARNTRYNEVRSGDVVVATHDLHHTIEIELYNGLSREISCDVYERVPVPAKGAEVVVSEGRVDPPWSHYEQRERGAKIEGGRKWKVVVASGARTKLQAEYVVKIYANNEVVGGNRREA